MHEAIWIEAQQVLHERRAAARRCNDEHGLLDRLPLEKDGARVEDERAAAFLDKQLEADYRSLGYNVERVPAMSVEDRVAMLLSEI